MFYVKAKKNAVDCSEFHYNLERVFFRDVRYESEESADHRRLYI
jgi:hypothetical protein